MGSGYGESGTSSLRGEQFTSDKKAKEMDRIWMEDGERET